MAWATIAAPRGAGSRSRSAHAGRPDARPAVVAALAILMLAATAAGQGVDIAPTVQVETQAAMVVSGSNSILAGVGINVPFGPYARVVTAVAVGPRLGATPGTTVHADLATRFLTDPFRETRWAPYVGGGITGAWNDGDHGRPGLLAVIGTDLPWGRAWTPSVELGVGAGVRVQVAFRRARRRGR